MQTDEQILLSEYKKYDYLNSDSKNPLIKIFVSYIKPSFLFKSEILTPIHLGRTIAKENSKDGVISDADLEWLYKNCIGDDDFEENISSVNRRVGFLTGTWWAYKNYEKLGNPEYFGSFGYRKLFASECLEDLKDYNLILPKKEIVYSNIKEQMTTFHGESLYTIITEIWKKNFPKDLNSLYTYFEQKEGYYHELYIMKRDLFFDYCNWIFPILNYLLQIDFSKYQDKKISVCQQYFNNKNDMRDIAFIVERITGYYLYKLKNNETKTLEVDVKKIISIDEKQKYKKILLDTIKDYTRKDMQI